MTTEAHTIAIGDELPSIKRHADADAIRAFGGYPLSDNIHTDAQYARERGLPGVIMEGLQIYSFVAEMLRQFFGASWFTGGKLELAFINVVTEGDSLTTRAVVTDVASQPDGTRRIELDAWCENQRGEKVAAGKASAIYGAKAEG